MRQILVMIDACHGYFILVTSNDFCLVGHTAPKTKEITNDSMCARAIQTCRMCLLLIDAKRNMEGKGGWEERHVALLELLVTLFPTALLREKQDRIAKAVACCEEALWR